jgi:urea transport system permease protein
VVPALNLAGVIEPYNLNRLSRYLCFAIAALGLDLIWGYAGVLTLAHALFFCLGAYAIAMHLSLPGGGGDVRPEYNDIPQFFYFNDISVLPVWWEPFGSLAFALAAGLLLPAVLAGSVGFLIFRNRVRGVYFAIITQALAWGAFLAFSRNELLLGGTNGLTNFYRPLNTDGTWILGLYLATASVLVLAFLGCRAFVRSRAGRVLVAIRDQETRLYFMGYRPDLYKAGAFALAALLAALGGILYAPQNGIITPNVMRVEDSIWMVIWVAVGGRGTLWGAMAGALVASFTYSMLTSDMPRAWPFIQAGLFLAVLAFPQGLAQLWTRLESDVRAGARLGWPLLVLGVVLLFLAADKLRWLPAALSMTEIAGIQAKYWLLGLVAAPFAWRARMPAAIPLLTLTGVVSIEAFGLLPGSARTLQYMVIALLLGYWAVRETGIAGRILQWSGARRPRLGEAA